MSILVVLLSLDREPFRAFLSIGVEVVIGAWLRLGS